MALPFYTIGHSTRPTAEFVDLLRIAEVAIVVDVRTRLQLHALAYNLGNFLRTWRRPSRLRTGR